MVEILLLGILGVVTGFLSGFFGIGGGAFLVPALMLLDLSIKEAIAISVLQMAFSSVVGSYFNFKSSDLKITNALFLGVGGFVGALFSGFVLDIVPALILQYIFIGFVVFAIYRFCRAKSIQEEGVQREEDGLFFRFIMFILGGIVGIFSISLGVGGGVLIGPIMAGFLRYSVKEAVVYSLFFVVFSSISGVLSMAYYGHLDYFNGFIVGIGAVFGVYIGVKVLNLIDAKRLKKYLIFLYIAILAVMVKKTILG